MIWCEMQSQSRHQPIEPHHVSSWLLYIMSHGSSVILNICTTNHPLNSHFDIMWSRLDRNHTYNPFTEHKQKYYFKYISYVGYLRKYDVSSTWLTDWHSLMELLWQTKTGSTSGHFFLLEMLSCLFHDPYLCWLLLIPYMSDNSLPVFSIISSFTTSHKNLVSLLKFIFFLGERSQIHIFKRHLNYRAADWPPVLQITFYWSTAALVHCYGCFIPVVAEVSSCHRKYEACDT